MIILVSILGGCASSLPFPVFDSPAPADLSRTADASVKGKVLTWGGSIIGHKNLPDRTLLEVMAYPLDGQGRPQTQTTALGRFLVDYPGFLDPMEYRAGRLLTVTGTMLGYTDGKVGQTPYRYPALQGERMHLWRHEPQQLHVFPQIHFGIGWDGDTYGGIGIGIGL